MHTTLASITSDNKLVLHLRFWWFGGKYQQIQFCDTAWGEYVLGFFDKIKIVSVSGNVYCVYIAYLNEIQMCASSSGTAQKRYYRFFWILHDYPMFLKDSPNL